MVPESTLEELETAYIAAQRCMTQLVVIKAKIESQPEEMAPVEFAWAIKKSAQELLESWRALYVALSPHVERDFLAVCAEPVEIGEIAFAESAHSAALWVTHQAIVSISIVLMPAGCWPSSEAHETDCFLADFRLETHNDFNENAVRVLRTVFGQVTLKDLRKCIVLAARECAAARSQLPPAGQGVPTKSVHDAAQKPIDNAKIERNDWLLEMRGRDNKPKMTETELSDALSKECENKPNWVHIEPKSISAALREAYKRQTGNSWPFDGRGRAKKTRE